MDRNAARLKSGWCPKAVGIRRSASLPACNLLSIAGSILGQTRRKDDATGFNRRQITIELMPWPCAPENLHRRNAVDAQLEQILRKQEEFFLLIIQSSKVNEHPFLTEMPPCRVKSLSTREKGLDQRGWQAFQYARHGSPDLSG